MFYSVILHNRVLIYLCVLFCWYVRQALNWIHDTGEFYLSTHTKLGEDKEETEALLKEYNEFKSAAKVRDSVFLQLLYAS